MTKHDMMRLPSCMGITKRAMPKKEMEVAKKENLMRALVSIGSANAKSFLSIGGKRPTRSFYYWGHRVYEISQEDYFTIATREGIPHPAYFHDLYFDSDFRTRHTPAVSVLGETCICYTAKDGRVVEDREYITSADESGWHELASPHPNFFINLVKIQEEESESWRWHDGYLLTTFESYTDTDTYENTLLFPLDYHEKVLPEEESRLYLKMAKELLL